ncbi:NAD(P)/FAD-dependent oxidoreductase [Paenibacillus rhizovicinus]|uniref:NAD(P)/FAD-dependent oxidoreductase n=2 Tax=Paenibacillus rhizovicinus TaxID=2704463 RepID=A0A6C0P8H1_9BACL|nr:NAD(P)/FAD-dependent oxidoreductase [Paenibacillus rhizovicinus]
MIDTAILGGGIAGSCMAILLARRGWKVALIDRRTFPRHKVCGEFLSPEAVDALVALGLGDRLQALRPAVVQRARLVFESGASIPVQLPGAAWGISRFSLDEALHEEARLAGAEVVTGTAVAAIHTRGDKYATEYELETKRGDKQAWIRSRAVIGAWGGNGHVLNFPGVQRSRPAPCPYIGVKSHLSCIEADGELELYFFKGGYLGLSSIGEGIVNAAALLDQSSFRPIPAAVNDWLEAAGARHPQLARRISKARPVTGTQTAVAPVRLFDDPLTWNGIPLIGDACVTIPPLCGDGMSMAIRSAQLCAVSADRYLRGDTSLQQWKFDYTKAITRHFRGPLRWGRVLQRALGNQQITTLGTVAASRLPGIVNRLMKATRLRNTDILPW